MSYIVHFLAWAAAATSFLLLGTFQCVFGPPIVLSFLWAFVLFFAAAALHTADVGEEEWDLNIGM
jgi:hypothetical protein